jgi:DedD protein
LQSEKNELMKQVGVSDQTAAQGQDDFLRPKLDFYDKLAKKGETEPLPATPPPSTQIPVPAPQVLPQPVPAEPAKTMTIPPVVEKPKAEKKEPPPESKVKKEAKGSPADTGLFMLQIGAYREEAVAQSSMNRLKEKGYPAHLSLKDIPQKGGKFYRVQLGPFKSKDEAEKMQAKLSQDGFQAIFIQK